MIRVLQVTGILNRGGAETMIMNLYRNINRKKIQFDFVANSLEKGVYEDEIMELGGNVYHCPHYCGTNIIEYASWWMRFFNEHSNEYSIIHGHIGSSAPIYLFIARLHKIITISHSHSISYRFVYKLHNILTRIIADRFISCSHLAAEAKFGKKIASDASKCLYLNNAICLSCYKFSQNDRINVRNELNIPVDALVYGHIGRFEPVKNHSFILKIWKELSTKNIHSYLILVGDGVLRKSIEEQADILALKDRIRFVGVRNDIPRLLCGMDCFLLPSKYEGLPLVCIEAQASGLTCLLSDQVPNEVDITGQCKFLSIKNIDLWINSALNIKASRSNCYDMIKRRGYDIIDTSIFLERYYFSLIDSFPQQISR